MKFKFSLQKVMEHRKIVENLAQKDFQDAVAALSAEQDILKKMEQQVQDSYNRSGDLLRLGGGAGPALDQINDFLKGQRVLVEHQKKNLQTFEKLVEDKREILRQSALDYKIMEKMREKKFEEYRAERISKDQKEMDEQSILRFKSVKES